MKTDTPTLIKALRVLAQDIQSGDGVANAAIAEAADRLEEFSTTTVFDFIRSGQLRDTDAIFDRMGHPIDSAGQRILLLGKPYIQTDGGEINVGFIMRDGEMVANGKCILGYRFPEGIEPNTITREAMWDAKERFEKLKGKQE
jgi:hypothetical protein